MTHRDALVELITACLAAPEDDAPRLVWADAVGGPRGELVVVQCDLSLDSDELPARAIALRRRRERELLREHGAAWSGLAGLATRCWYRRGFVDRVELHVDRLFDRADQILAKTPFLRTLAIRGLDASELERGKPDPVDRLAELAETALLRAVRGLDLRGMGWTREHEMRTSFHSAADEGLERLARVGILQKLEALVVDGLDWEGTRTLISAGVQLDELVARRTAGPADLEGLIDRQRRLTRLEISGLAHFTAIAARAPGTLREVRLIAGDRRPVDADRDQPGWISIDRRTLSSLAASPAASSIERLALANGTLGNIASLGDFPRLKELELVNMAVDGPYVLDSLLAVPMPRLRYVTVTGATSLHIAEAFAQGFGDQLARLALEDPQMIDQLGVAIAGDVVCESPDDDAIVLAESRA